MRPGAQRTEENRLLSVLRSTWTVCVQILWCLHLILHTIFYYLCSIQRYNPISIILERRGRLSALDCYGNQLYRPGYYEQLSDVFATDQQLKGKLLKWLADILPQNDITNFHSCWNDGITLCALLEAICPGVCPHYIFLQNHCRVNNCRLALRLANEYFNIPSSLISAEEIAIADEFNGSDNIYRLVHTVKLAAEYLQYQQARKDTRSLEMLATFSCRSCVVSGKGISYGTVGRKAEFTISLQKRCPLYLKINILAPTTRSSEPTSPETNVTTGDAITDLQSGLQYGDNKTKTDAFLVVNDRKDSDGSSKTDSAFKMLPFDYKILPDGKALVGYVPRNSGYHYIRVRVHEQDVDGSPFRVLITHPTLTYQDSRSTFRRSFLMEPSWTVIDNDKKITVKKKRILRRILIPRILKNEQNKSNEWQNKEGLSDKIDEQNLNTSPAISLALKFLRRRSSTSSYVLKSYRDEDEDEGELYDDNTTIDLNDDDIAIDFRPIKSLESQDLQNPRREKEESVTKFHSDHTADCRFSNLKVDTNSEYNFEYLTPGSSPCPFVSEDDNSSSVYFDAGSKSDCENDRDDASSRKSNRGKSKSERLVRSASEGFFLEKGYKGDYVSVYAFNVREDETPRTELSGKEENEGEGEEQEESGADKEEGGEEEGEYENQEEEDQDGETEEEEDDDNDEEEEEEEDGNEDEEEEAEEEAEEEEGGSEDKENSDKSKVKKRRDGYFSRRVTAPLQCRVERSPKSILKSKRSAFSSVKRSSPKLASPNTSDVSHDSFSDELFLSYPLARRHKDSLIKNKECFSSLGAKKSSPTDCQRHSPVHSPQASRHLYNKQFSYDEFLKMRRREEHEIQKKRQERRKKEKSVGVQTSRPKSPISTHFRSEDSDSSSISIPRNMYRSNEKLAFSKRYCKAIPSGRVTPWVMKPLANDSFQANQSTMEHSGAAYDNSEADRRTYPENYPYNIGFEKYQIDSLTFENRSLTPEDSLQRSPARQRSPDSNEISQNHWSTDMNFSDPYYNEGEKFADSSFPSWGDMPISCGPIRNRSRKCSCQKKDSNWIPISNKDILRLRVCPDCHNSVGFRSAESNRRPMERSPISSSSPASDVFNSPSPFNIPHYPMCTREDVTAPSPTDTTRSEGTETYRSEIQILIKSPRRDKQVQTIGDDTKTQASTKKTNSVTVKKSKLLVLHNYAFQEDHEKVGASGKGVRTIPEIRHAATCQPNPPAIFLDASRKMAGNSPRGARDSEGSCRGDNLENQRFVHSWLNDYPEQLAPRQSTMETIDSGIAIDSRSSSPQRPATLGGRDPPSSMSRTRYSHPSPINAEDSRISNHIHRQQMLQAHYEQLQECTGHFLQRQQNRQKEQKYMNVRENLPEGRSESPPCTGPPIPFRSKSTSSLNKLHFVPHYRHSVSKSLHYTGCSYDTQSSPVNGSCSYAIPQSSPVSSSQWTKPELKERNILPQVRQFGNGGLLQAIIRPYEEKAAQKNVDDTNDETSEMEFWSSGGYRESTKTDEDSQFLTASYGGRVSSRTTLSDNFDKSNVSQNKNRTGRENNDSEENSDYHRRLRFYDERMDFVATGDVPAHHFRRRRQPFYHNPLAQSRPHYSSANSLFTEGGTPSPVQFNSSPADIYAPEHIECNPSLAHCAKDHMLYSARSDGGPVQRPKQRQQLLGFRPSMRQYQSYASGLNELPLTDTDDGLAQQTTTSSLSSDKNLYAQYMDRSDATDFSSLMEMEELPSTSEAALNEVHGYRSDNPENLSPAGSLVINDINYGDEECGPWCTRYPDHSINPNSTTANFKTNRKIPSSASDHRDYYSIGSVDSRPKRFRSNMNPLESSSTCYSDCKEARDSDRCMGPVIKPPFSNHSGPTSDVLAPGTEMLFHTLHRAITNVQERPHNECYALGPGLDNGYVQATNFFQVRTVSGRGPLTVGIRGPRTNNTVLETSVIYSEDSVYDVTYRVSTPGCYTIDVKWAGSHIHQSPFICKVMP